MFAEAFEMMMAEWVNAFKSTGIVKEYSQISTQTFLKLSLNPMLNPMIGKHDQQNPQLEP